MPRPNRPRPIPPDPDGWNDRRAGWAGEALDKFVEATRSESLDVLADLLCDLKHWCDRNGMSFSRELERACGLYKEETMAPQGPVTPVQVPPPTPPDPNDIFGTPPPDQEVPF